MSATWLGASVSLTGALAGALAVERTAVRREREAVVRAAHELRGALTTITLATETRALRPGLPDRDRAIAAALDRARVALDDLTPARRPPVLESFDARTLLDACVSAARPLAGSAGVELLTAWEGPPAVLLGERPRLALALTNLLANAIEHGAGAVTARGRSADGVVRFAVSDEGPGLPASLAVLSRRARAGVGRRGRGLAIASEVAARHRGHLTAASTASGARLELVVPSACEAGPPGAVA